MTVITIGLKKMKKPEKKNHMDIINDYTSSLNAFGVECALLVAVCILLQSAWGFISGLYFPFAWEMTVLPYVLYISWSFFLQAQGKAINLTKHCLLAACFLMLFSPSFYLVASEQVSIQTAIFGSFDASLQHMPYADMLPKLFLCALISPVKDVLNKRSREKLKYSNIGK